MLFKRGFVPFEDREILESFYVRNPPPMFNVEPHLFIWEIEQQFKNDLFVDYINRETHYEIVRRGYEWDEKIGLFSGLVDCEYREIRKGILEKFAEIFIGNLSAGKFDFEPCSLKISKTESRAAA